jgi:hypothetical protein
LIIIMIDIVGATTRRFSKMSTQDNGIATITGASSGLGRIYADRFATRGYNLILIARRKERLDALAQELHKKYGVNVDVVVADLGNEADLDRVGKAIAANDKITVLVNSAGTAAFKPSVDLPIDVVENQLNVNAKAATHLSLSVLPNFVKRNSGTIINISSVLGFFAFPISTSYSATKAHVLLFTIGLRDELANTGVRVQLVVPASTDTELWDVAGVGIKAVDPQTVMSAENCVDAALAGLDSGETVTLPSVEDASLWETFDGARAKLFQASQTKNPASRYGIGR